MRTFLSRVSEGFFEVMQTPLLQGRTFLRSDDSDAPPVVIVNRAFADSAWAGENPVGRRLKFGSSESPGPWYTVVGVVGNAREEWLSIEPEPIVYRSLRQQFSPFVRIVARADGEISSVAPALRQAVLRADPHLSLTPVVSMADLNSLDTLPQRMASAVTLGLGGLALFLAGGSLRGEPLRSCRVRQCVTGIDLRRGPRSVHAGTTGFTGRPHASAQVRVT